MNAPSSHPDPTAETAGLQVPAGPAPGLTAIGRYRIRRLIGSGGMGAVYEAVQDQPRRTVALKVMRTGIASRTAMRRFEYEAQLLGRLRHPGIAQVFEAGAQDFGAGPVPFFAMEYIPAAKTLTEFAEDRRLTVRDRLDLFLKVCDAVHHGHTKGVIHRDLKPANILVDPAGQPRIIDFGVARATDADIAVTTIHTDVGQLVGTLQYMSPEQCAADPHDIDTRSDVYALGVVLYELLTARLPYEISGVAMFDAARIVRERPPIRPSAANKALRGDLETITLKALEKDRERRYRSASEFADDIKRYLADEPVNARPPSLPYQLRMFARRNRALVGLVGASALLIVAAVAGTGWGLVQVHRARDAALIEADNANALNDFLRDMLTLASPARSQGNTITVREALDQASLRLASLPPGRPEVEAAIHAVIGTTYRSLGLYDKAEPHLHQALELRTTALGPEAPPTLVSMTDMALLWNDQGRSDEAAQRLAATLDIQRRRLGPLSADTLRTTSALAWVLRDQGKSEASEDLFRAALEGYKRTSGPRSPQSIKATTELAMVLIDAARLDEADTLLSRAIEAAPGVLGARHPDLFYMKNTRGWLLYTAGRYEEAAVVFQDVVSSAEQVMPADHAWLLMWKDNLGWSLVKSGRFADGERILRSIIEPSRRTLGDEFRETIRARLGLAAALGGLGRYDEAERLALDAHAVASRRGPGWLRQLAAATLADLYTAWNKPERAAEFESQARQR